MLVSVTEDPTPDELAIVAQLRSSLRKFAAATDEIGAHHELTARQYDLCLLVANGQGNLIGREVAEALHLGANTASELISRAEHDGLVKRHTSASDTRLKPLALTSEGRRRFNGAFNELRPERARLLAILEESVRLASRLLSEQPGHCAEPDPDVAIWVTHTNTNLTFVRGTLEKLEALGAREFTQLRIITLVPDEGAVAVGGRVIGAEELAAEGVVLLIGGDD